MWKNVVDETDAK